MRLSKASLQHIFMMIEFPDKSMYGSIHVDEKTVDNWVM